MQKTYGGKSFYMFKTKKAHNSPNKEAACPDGRLSVSQSDNIRVSAFLLILISTEIHSGLSFSASCGLFRRHIAFRQSQKIARYNYTKFA